MTTKMSKQAEINYLRGRVNQLENQLAAARSLIAIAGIEVKENQMCECGHEKTEHMASGSHECWNCECNLFKSRTP